MSRLCHDSRVNGSMSSAPRPVTSTSSRIRLDQLVVDRGLAASRARAQALILGGHVHVGAGDAVRSDRKAGDLVDPSVPLAVDAAQPYVSRGGHKLAAALDAFQIDPRDLVCLDVGSSTGGFTDVLLQRGARIVYALDVGRGQLAESLRQDPRVVSMERTNARSLNPGSLPEAMALAVIDVAFISLELVLEPVASTFGPGGGSIVALIKPQFEAGRGQVPGGVVRDPSVHRSVVEAVVLHATAHGLEPRDVIASPLLGPEGNREFLVHLVIPARAADTARGFTPPMIESALAARIVTVTSGDPS